MEQTHYPGKAALQQRVLPAYRIPFFDTLDEACLGGLSVFAGQPISEENIKTGQNLQAAQYTPAINQHFMSPGSFLYRCNQPGILDWLGEWNPDILILEANTRYPSNSQAIAWMHDQGRPVIGWGLGAPGSSGMLGIWKQRRRIKLLNSLDAVISYSRKGAEEYAALGVSEDKIFVALNAVRPRPVASPPRRKQSFNDQPEVLFVGRLQARKKIDNLLRACSALPDHLCPRLTIIGDGPSTAELKALADRIYPSTQFLGAIHGSDLDTYFEKADLFVLPGTGGLAVQQAMGFALPVIVAQGDGTQADLVRPENGWLVPNNDVEALRNTLVKALSDPQGLRQMGEISYTIVKEEINLETMVSVFVRALTETRYHQGINQ